MHVNSKKTLDNRENQLFFEVFGPIWPSPCDLYWIFSESHCLSHLMSEKLNTKTENFWQLFSLDLTKIKKFNTIVKNFLQILYKKMKWYCIKFLNYPVVCFTVRKLKNGLLLTKGPFKVLKGLFLVTDCTGIKSGFWHWKNIEKSGVLVSHTADSSINRYINQLWNKSAEWLTKKRTRPNYWLNSRTG